MNPFEELMRANSEMAALSAEQVGLLKVLSATAVVQGTLLAALIEAAPQATRNAAAEKLAALATDSADAVAAAEIESAIAGWLRALNGMR